MVMRLELSQAGDAFLSGNYQLYNVLVTAHTGSGKTVPAIYAISDSIQKNKKIIYTSPIKSLSNQKLFELKHVKFPKLIHLKVIKKVIIK